MVVHQYEKEGETIQPINFLFSLQNEPERKQLRVVHISTLNTTQLLRFDYGNLNCIGTVQYPGIIISSYNTRIRYEYSHSRIAHAPFVDTYRIPGPLVSFDDDLAYLSHLHPPSMGLCALR